MNIQKITNSLPNRKFLRNITTLNSIAMCVVSIGCGIASISNTAKMDMFQRQESVVREENVSDVASKAKALAIMSGMFSLKAIGSMLLDSKLDKEK